MLILELGICLHPVALRTYVVVVIRVPFQGVRHPTAGPPPNILWLTTTATVIVTGTIVLSFAPTRPLASQGVARLAFALAFAFAFALAFVLHSICIDAFHRDSNSFHSMLLSLHSIVLALRIVLALHRIVLARRILADGIVTHCRWTDPPFVCHDRHDRAGASRRAQERKPPANL
jgi:hypothetical protein